MSETGSSMDEEHKPRLIWDLGTAYDLFVSLEVLHHPEEFGLRPSWAAGVRSRLSSDDRKVLEDANLMLHIPLPWISSLSEPKDSATALWTLGKMSPAERLLKIAICCEEPDELGMRLMEITRRRAWNDGDLEALRAAYKHKRHHLQPDVFTSLLDWWARPDEFGDVFLVALRSYYQVFFAEEELRIRQALEQAQLRAQEMAGKIAVVDLIEFLSQGVRFNVPAEISELVLAPSYWSTPLIIFDETRPPRMFIVYGARPADASLIPGEAIPDTLLQVLKALADPTRLRILRYLSSEPLNPAQLSRRLRLRAPTVVHHLSELRLAGLVHVYLEEGGEKRYTVREEMLKDISKMLEDFLLP